MRAYATLLLLIPGVTSALADLPPVGPEPIQQVHGYYSTTGFLTDSTELPAEGDGFKHIFRHRRHSFGSFGVIEILTNAARELKGAGERLQIADISAQNGGRLAGHGSHRNGLDVDLIYFRKNKREYSNRATHMTEKFVKDFALTRNFDVARNMQLIKTLVSSGRVARIFVDPVIKAALCNHAPRETEALRRLQPYPHHDDHLHVRFTCPAESPECVPQAELPRGSGCRNARMIVQSLQTGQTDIPGYRLDLL